MIINNMERRDLYLNIKIIKVFFYWLFFLNIPIPDLTSGFYAIKSKQLFIKLKKIKSFLSNGHFVETELKFLFKKYSYSLVNITYRTYNNTISILSIIDAIKSLIYLFLIRIKFKI